MWGKPNFFFTDNVAVGIADINLAAAWYREKLGLRQSSVQVEELDAFLVLSEDDEEGIGLVRLGAGLGRESFERHPILYTKKIETVHKDFSSRAISVGPIQADSGGNRFFTFQDLDGNTIEVCVEP